MVQLAEHNQFSPAAEPLAVIAIIDNYDSLLATLRVCIGQVNTTHSAIEMRAGLPSGYLSKCCGPRHVKHFGPALFHVLHVLGLRLALIEDPQLVEKYRNHLEPRQRPREARGHWRWWKRPINQSAPTVIPKSLPGILRSIGVRGLCARPGRSVRNRPVRVRRYPATPTVRRFSTSRVPTRRRTENVFTTNHA